jgi:adenylate cyclase, class 2
LHHALLQAKWWSRMVEVEIKYPAPATGNFEQQIGKLGAEFAGERHERDQYFNAPDRDFGQTDEALRIRQVGDSIKFTYKGPKREQLTKTRTEIEVSVAEEGQGAEYLAEILTCLKYRPAGVVEKRRRIYRLPLQGFTAEISLDSVSGLGSYVELEIVVPEEKVDAARTALLKLAGKLGLNQAERRSYLELILSRGAGKT